MEWNVDGYWTSELAKFANYRGLDGKQRKLNETDVTSKLRDLVYSYLNSYEGDSTFLLSLKYQAKVRLNSHISTKQVAGAANWIINEYRAHLAEAKADARAFDKRHNTGGGSSYSDFVTPFQPSDRAEDQEFTIDYSQVARPSRKAVEPSDLPTPTFIPPSNTAPALGAAIASDATKPALPDGTYTIVLPSGLHRTIRLVRAPENMQKYDNTTQLASFLSGPDNESDYTNFAFVNGRSWRVWSKFKGSQISAAAKALAMLLEADDPFKYGEAYAMASGNCFICGRKLTVPASLHNGMGPICAAKNGR